MRKISGLIFVVIAMFGALVACGDNADALAEGCKKGGGDKAACECVKQRAGDEMTDDEIEKATKEDNPDEDLKAQLSTIFDECINGTGDGTDDGGTDTGS